MKFRLLCFGFHLIISLVIALISLCTVFGVWYPSPLDKALGVTDVFLLLLCIDVILGPLLTLLVAKQNKKTLKLDLFTIGIIQVAALIYGLYIVAQGRPVWLIYDNNRFDVVQAYEAVVVPNSSKNNIFQLSFTGPIWGAVIDAVPQGVARPEAFYQAAYLQEYSLAAKKGGANSIHIDVLKRFNATDKVVNVLSEYPNADGFIPMVGKQRAQVVLVNKLVGEPIAIVDLAPW